MCRWPSSEARVCWSLQGRVLPNATGVVCDVFNDPGSCVNFTALASPSPSPASSAPTPVPIAGTAELSSELPGAFAWHSGPESDAAQAYLMQS